MNGIHDLGGMHGFGHIPREQDPEPVFHARWESRVYGIVTTIREERDVYAPYGSRHYIESIPPARYLAASYYEKWMLALEAALVNGGLIAKSEMDARANLYAANPAAPVPSRADPALADRVRRRIYAPAQPAPLPQSSPRYALGDAVRARNIHPPAHTRLPRYVRGKRGVIERVYPAQPFQDLQPIDGAQTGDPLPVYSVRFDARELWGDHAEPNQALYIDMWETYLEPAESAESA